MIDALCMSGVFPFRRFSMTAREVAEKLARRGFEECYMFSLTALFHRNPLPENEAFLREDVDGVGCRVHKLAVVNLGFEDVEGYLKMGFEGFVTSPVYQGYRLAGRDVVRRALRVLESNALVILNLIEDVRQFPRAYGIRFPIMPGEVASFLSTIAKSIEEPRVLLSHFPYSDLVKIRQMYGGSVYIDLASSQVLGAPYGQVEDLVKLYGDDHVVLATGFMMKYPSSSILKIQLANLPEESVRRIVGINAKRLYGH